LLMCNPQMKGRFYAMRKHIKILKVIGVVLILFSTSLIRSFLDYVPEKGE